MEFRILGPLEVFEDGAALDLGAQKHRALLAVLVIHANEVVSTDRLVDALWEDAPPERAQKALQVYVSQLRKLVGRERLLTKAPGYLLQVAPGEIDVAHFERLIDDGKAKEALALWRGQPLSDFAYSRFAQREIARLEELRVSALEDRIEADLAVGRHAAVVGELEALISEHPLRERLHGQLMLALYRSGRQAEALEAYQGARRVLTDELGIELGRELRELERKILLQDPSLDSAAPGIAVDAEDGAFVGREDELQQLVAALDEALAGRGRVVLIAGEPGIGKSRLCEELIAHARARRARVLVGRCWEAGGAPAYWPWIQALRTYLQDSSDDAARVEVGIGAEELVQVLPELRHLFPDLPELPSAESESARFRLFDATASFLKRSASARPLVLVLDDLHAADTPSLLLLEFLASELGRSRILIIGAFRDVDPTLQEPLTTTLAALGRQAGTKRLGLAGITESDVAELIRLTEGVEASGALVEAVHDETEGNPLFVGEVVRLLAQEGLLEGGREEVKRMGVPGGVREVIGRRLSHLSEKCRQVLTFAAILGREFDLAAVEQVSGVSLHELLETLDEAMTARVVIEAPGTRGRLRFAHTLIRDTIYEELTPARRIGLHRLAGEALEALYAHDLDPHLAELAHHFFDAAPGGEVERAVGYARRAADRAVELLAYEEAARLYEQGLQALELKQPVEPLTHCELLLALGHAQVRAGDAGGAKQTFLDAVELARNLDQPDALAQAALGYGGRFVWGPAGVDPRLVPLLREALAAAGDLEPALRVRLLARLAAARRDEFDPGPRARLSHEAVELARAGVDPATLAYALVARYAALWSPDNQDERLAVATELVELAQSGGAKEREIEGRGFRFNALLELGELAAARTELAARGALAEEMHQPAQLWVQLVLETAVSLLVGEFSTADEMIHEAFALGQRAQGEQARADFELQRFALRREQGRLAEIESELEAFVKERRAAPPVYHCAMASVSLALHRDDEARRRVVTLAQHDFRGLPWDGHWMFAATLLAEICGALDDRRSAEALYPLLLPYSQRNVGGWGAVSTGAVSRYLGILAACMARFDDADGHFEDALAMNERMGARPWLAHTQEDYGRALISCGDDERGNGLVESAMATYRKLGMDGPLGRATAAMGG